MLEPSHIVIKPFKILKTLKVSLNESGYCPSLSNNKSELFKSIDIDLRFYLNKLLKNIDLIENTE